MQRDLSSLEIGRVIAHPVPKRYAHRPEAPLGLCNAESDLTVEIRNYLSERISESLGRAASDVVFAANSPSPVPALIERCLGGDVVDLVQVSAEMASYLYISQTGVNTEGVLLVALASLRKQPALAILKLEHEAGLRSQVVSSDGRIRSQFEYIRELVLQRNNRIFKIGLFARPGPGEGLWGLVSDNQRRYRRDSSVAGFFLSGFLGCRPRDAPDVTTQSFFNVTEQFINDDVSDPERKGQYCMALLTEMNSLASTINPSEFAYKHLASEDGERFLRSLQDNSVPTTQFDKNTQLIDRKIKRMKIDFESGIAVLGLAEAFQAHVDVKALPDGKAKVEIEDVVKRVQA